LSRGRPKTTTGAEAAPSSFPRFAVRVLGSGSLLIFVNSYWIIATENRYIHTGGLSVFSLFPTVVFTLALVTSVNQALRRWAPRWAFTPGELAGVYAMTSVGAALAGHDVIKQLVPYLGNAFWYATPENDWASSIQPYLPTWLTVRDRSILQGWYEGGSTFWRQDVVRAWTAPFLWWTLFAVVILIAMLCINAILRRQWMDHEKLNYPVAQIAIEIIGDGERFFGNRLMWVGFAFAFLIEAAAGLNFLFPSIPMIRLKYDFGPLFTEKPWNAMHGLPVFFYAFATGLAYLMPVDLSFSLWFFYLTWKAQFILVSVLGLPQGDAWHAEQRAGAWLALALVALWSGRHHLARVARDGWSGSDRTYRWAAGGLAGSLVFVLAFARAAGIQWWVVILYFTLYFTFCIAATRMRAELGPPTHELHNVHPERLMVIFGGMRAVGVRNLAPLGLFAWLPYGYRCHPMPHQMEGYRIGSRFGLSVRRISVALILAAIFGTVFGIGLHMVEMYRFRQIYIMRGPFIQLGAWLPNPPAPDLFNSARVVLGFVITIALSFLKRRFVAWPLYPVGYAVSYGWAISWMWFSIFLGWAAKKTILVSGGIGAYRRAIPLFIGLVLGQFVAGSLWAVVALITRHTVYSPFP